MKYGLLVCTLFVLCLRAVGQSPSSHAPASSGTLQQGAVVLVPGVSATELFLRAQVFARSSTVTPLVDESANAIVGRWEQAFGNVRLNYELRVWVREGRYRYEVNDLKLRMPPVTFHGYKGIIGEEASYLQPLNVGKLTAPLPALKWRSKPNKYDLEKQAEAQVNHLAEQNLLRAALQQATVDLQHLMNQPTP